MSLEIFPASVLWQIALIRQHVANLSDHKERDAAIKAIEEALDRLYETAIEAGQISPPE